MGMDTGIRVQPLFDLPASVSPRGCGAASPDGTEKRAVRDSGKNHSARGENHRPAERRASVREASDGSVLEDPESRPGDIGREGPPGLQILGSAGENGTSGAGCVVSFAGSGGHRCSGMSCFPSSQHRGRAFSQFPQHSPPVWEVFFGLAVGRGKSMNLDRHMKGV